MTVGALAAGKRDESRAVGLAWADVLQLGGIAVQLGLALLVIREFQLESRTFFNVMLLVAGGFLVNAVLPLRYRLWWFVLLSLGGIGLAFGAAGFWLVAVGLGLITICHLPLSWWARVVILLAVGAFLAAVRADVIGSPVSMAVWPLLGSMFMFRLILYMHSMKHEKVEPSARTLAYFFMLPNVPFPLFPIVDHKTFQQVYYNGEAAAIYQRGVRWIARGAVHLILYRLVYHYVAVDPTTVHELGGVLLYVISAYLMYLRVSGMAHIAMGILHLFGWKMPPTNQLYFLARNFTDLWRRNSIYWKDFIMKVVYYPTFFPLRKLGNAKAMALATVVVFVVTWFVHSYQWFWLRGANPFSLRDLAFWAMIVLLIGIQMQRDAKVGAAARLAKPRRWSAERALSISATFATLALLWSFWTADSTAEWWSILGAAGSVSPGTLVLILAIVAAGFLAAGWNWGTKTLGDDDVVLGPLRHRPGLQTAALLGGVLLVGQTGVYEAAWPGGARVMTLLRTSTLNARDERMLTRGYYEQLGNVGALNSQLWDAQAEKPVEERPFFASGGPRLVDNFLYVELIPDNRVMYYDLPFTTNRWGMRDQDYELAKPPGTFRIALLGPSDVMGSGVGDRQKFETLVEDRLNRERGPRYQRYEVLNFAVGGYSLLQQVPTMEERVLRFSPDLFILVAHPHDRTKMLEHLWDVTRSEIPIPYPGLQAVVREAGLTPTMDITEALRRLRPYEDSLLAWVYTRLADSIRARQAPAVLVTMRMPSAPSEMDSTHVRLARRAGWEVIDLMDVYDGRDETALRLHAADKHPNRAGHRLIAGRLFAELARRSTALGLDLAPADSTTTAQPEQP